MASSHRHISEAMSAVPKPGVSEGLVGLTRNLALSIGHEHLNVR